MNPIATAQKALSPEAPRFLALELDEPPVTALVEVKRADHSSFESTRAPTHADVTVFADNGGATRLDGLDLKLLGAAGLLDAIAAALPQAHAAGLKGDDAAIMGRMIVDAAAARHLARNFEAA